MHNTEKSIPTSPLPPSLVSEFGIDESDNYMNLLAIIFFLEMYIRTHVGDAEMTRLRMEIGGQQDWIIQEFDVYLLEQFSIRWLL